MSTEDNKATVRRAYEEGLNQGNVAVFDELCAPSYSFHDPDRPDVRTLEDHKRLVTETHSAFPDFHVTIEDLIAEGEQVVVRWTMRGTHTGEIVMPAMHVPATGKQGAITAIDIFHLAGGKIVEQWSQVDYLGLYQLLGLIPVPQSVG